MGANKKTIVNVVCSLMVLVTNIIINFWMSPFIVENIGVEANGFVTLANNFVTYAQLIVTALNSMACRFIAISYVKKDYKKANLFYNSVFWGNLIIVAILIIPAIYLIARLEHIADVPENIMMDVKCLFGFVFFNFFITTGLPNWDCGTYVTNRLDRTYIPQMLAAVIRCLFLVSLFVVFSPKVYYVGIAATLMTSINLFAGWYNTHKLTPELRVYIFGKQICSKSAIKELVGSGMWNSISSVGNMLLSGLDLIICNVFLGATKMGILSLSKIIPNYMQQMSISIRNAFAPELTINYAGGNKDAVLKDINRAMKITSIILTIPIAIVITLGKEFFSLWVPTQDAKLLQILSILAILGYMFTSGTQILYNVFSTVNKVKPNAIAMVSSGVVSVIITTLLIKFTDLGIYAVAGVSTFVNLVRNMTFTLPSTAKYLGYKWNKFYPQVINTVISSVLLLVIYHFIHKILPSGSWISLIISACILGVIGLIINIMLMLNKTERKFLFDKFDRKLHISKFIHRGK